MSLLQTHASSIVVVPSGCWIWVGSNNGSGYGEIRKGGRKHYTHRAEYESAKGPIPPGLQIDHLCRERACCNPDHLEPVTGGENSRRGDCGKHHAVKTHCPHGHAYTPENTYVNPRGSRVCRACKPAQVARWKAKAALAAAMN